MEVWIPIEDFPGYSVSSYGRVRNDRFERVLTVLKNRGGVAMVSMVRNGSQTKKSLGKLVAEAFVEVPRYRIPFDTVIHLDGDNMNNHPSNLMWRPHWFAGIHGRQFKIDWEPTLPIRDCETREEYADMWDVVIRNGLLCREVMRCTFDQTPVFPTFQRFEWVI